MQGAERPGRHNRGKRWYKGTLHYVLRNEAYTGTAVWGRNSKGEKAQDPVRVEGAWPALVSRELFDAVQQRCETARRRCGNPVEWAAGPAERVAEVRRVRQALLGPGSQERPVRLLHLRHPVQGRRGDVQRPLPDAPRLEAFVVEKIRERILNEETIVALVQLVAEEIDAIAGEMSGRLEVIEAELGT